MTSDELRESLRQRIAASERSPSPMACPMCHGTGTVVRPRKALTQADVAKILGVGRTSVVNFLSGNQGFTMDVTLRLLDWLMQPWPVPEIAREEAGDVA